MSYYGNVNVDLFNALNMDALRVLEIGGGDGSMARAYAVENSDAHYFGVEIVSDVAAKGASDFEALIVGDVEDDLILGELDRASSNLPFDMLVIGDVLEHLHDPWTTMSKLRDRMSVTGKAFVCIPNVGHWSLIVKQMRGDWEYADQGLLDKTHLRFFTRQTATDMFVNAGWTVDHTLPRIFHKESGEKVVNAVSELARVAGIPMASVRQNLMPTQWVFSLSAGSTPCN